MADVIFKVEKVHRHAEAMAERVAVLKQLAPAFDLTKDDQVRAAAFKVLDVWRRRLNVLRQAKWDRVQGVKFQYARNCPPACVSMRPEARNGYTRPCALPTLCPWCWCRDVVKRTWDVVVPVMEATGSMWAEDRVAPYPFHLVTGVATGRTPDADTQPHGLLDQVSGQLSRSKHWWAAKSHGVAFLGGVAPTTDGDWLYTARVIALVPADTPVAEGYTRVTHPTRRNVAAAVARFARYPAGLMFGDPAMAIRVLDARAHYRMYRLAGAFSACRRARPPAAADDDTRFLDL